MGLLGEHGGFGVVWHFCLGGQTALGRIHPELHRKQLGNLPWSNRISLRRDHHATAPPTLHRAIRLTVPMTPDSRLLAAAYSHDAHMKSPGSTTALVEQVETAEHLFRGGFDGVVSVATAFEHAWLGLGVADQLDGEIVVVDGVVWRVPATGIPEVADPDLTVPFAISERRAAADVINEVDIPTGTTLDELGGMIDTDDSHCVTLRLEGTFTDVVLRSERRQTPPYRPIDEVLSPDSNQEVRFAFPRWEGVLVGYRFPDVKLGVSLPGLHLHGLSHDQRSGGHVREVTVDSGKLSWVLGRSTVTLPSDHFGHLLGAPAHHHGDIREGIMNGESHADLAQRFGMMASPDLD